MKIFSKALSARLCALLPDLVGPEQSGGVRGRNISDNILALKLATEYCRDKSIPSLLFSLDLHKAYDMIEHNYIWHTLTKFGFGPNFIHMVRVYYNQVSSSVLVNGHVSPSFPVQRGVRQGCSLSPPLFILVLETFLCEVRRDPAIIGVSVPGTSVPFKYIAHVDDSDYLLRDRGSLDRLLEVFNRFSGASGSSINERKAGAVWIRRDDLAPSPHDHFFTHQLKILGVNFNSSGTFLPSRQALLKAYAGILDNWKQVQLPFRSKIQVINTCAIPTVSHLFGVVSFPSSLLRQINKLNTDFFWNSGLHKVGLQVLGLRRELGGLGFPDLTTLHRVISFTNFVRLLRSDNPGKYFLCYLASTEIRRFGTTVPPMARRGVVHPSVAGPVADALHVKATGLDIDEWYIRKRVYIALNIRPPPPICATFPHYNWDLVWARVLGGATAGEVSDVAWLAAQGRLPTANILARFHVRRTDRCDSCGGYEDVGHALVACPNARGLWAWLRPLLQVPVLTFRDIVYLHLPNTPAYRVYRTIVLINIGKFAIWKTRCLHSLGRPVPPSTTKAIFYKTASEKIKYDFGRLPLSRFKGLWDQSVVHFKDDAPFLVKPP